MDEGIPGLGPVVSNIGSVVSTTDTERIQSFNDCSVLTTEGAQSFDDCAIQSVPDTPSVIGPSGEVSSPVWSMLQSALTDSIPSSVFTRGGTMGFPGCHNPCIGPMQGGPLLTVHIGQVDSDDECISMHRINSPKRSLSGDDIFSTADGGIEDNVMHSFIPPSGSETTRGPGGDAPPAPRVAHRYFHRLDRFDPTSESFECFERRFNEFADHFGWPEGSKLFNLKQCVPRESEGILYSGDRVDSFTSLFQALRERYGNKRHTATLRRLELQGLQPKPGDSLTSLFHDVNRQ